MPLHESDLRYDWTTHDDLRRRVACFDVADQMLKRDMPSVCELFAKLRVVPYRIDDDFWMAKRRYYAFSPFFDVCPEATEPPVVDVVVTRGRGPGGCVEAIEIVQDGKMVTRLGWKPGDWVNVVVGGEISEIVERRSYAVA